MLEQTSRKDKEENRRQGSLNIDKRSEKLKIINDTMNKNNKT